MVKITCKRKGLTFNHNGSPNYNITFTSNEMDVSAEAAKHLQAAHPSYFAKATKKTTKTTERED